MAASARCQTRAPLRESSSAAARAHYRTTRRSWDRWSVLMFVFSPGLLMQWKTLVCLTTFAFGSHKNAINQASCKTWLNLRKTIRLGKQLETIFRLDGVIFKRRKASNEPWKTFLNTRTPFLLFFFPSTLLIPICLSENNGSTLSGCCRWAPAWLQPRDWTSVISAGVKP